MAAPEGCFIADLQHTEKQSANSTEVFGFFLRNKITKK